MGRYEMDTKDREIDYSHFDDRFENKPVKIGHEWSELDQKREEYIRNNALDYKKTFSVPDIEGLEIARFPKVPSTRRWGKPIASFEKNGLFNFWTHNLNVKAKLWLFFPTVVFGITVHVLEGWHFYYYNQARYKQMYTYEKLGLRELPFSRFWARPG